MSEVTDGYEQPIRDLAVRIHQQILECTSDKQAMLDQGRQPCAENIQQIIDALDKSLDFACAAMAMIKSSSDKTKGGKKHGKH
jgi:hypothetical protein